MPGETAKDERIQDQQQAFKVNVFIETIDTISVNLQQRLTEEHIGIMEQMHLFTSSNLLRGNDIDGADIDKLCKFYEFDSTQVTRELNELRSIHPQLHEIINFDDIASVSARTSGVNHEMADTKEEGNDGMDEDAASMMTEVH